MANQSHEYGINFQRQHSNSASVEVKSRTHFVSRSITPPNAKR